VWFARVQSVRVCYGGHWPMLEILARARSGEAGCARVRLGMVASGLCHGVVRYVVGAIGPRLGCFWLGLVGLGCFWLVLLR